MADKDPSNSSSSAASRVDGTTVERNARNHTKTLFVKLNSLVPRDQHQAASSSTAASSKELMSLPNQIDEATKYIKKQQANLERLREKKSKLLGTVVANKCITSGSSDDTAGSRANLIIATSPSLRSIPQIEVHTKDNLALDVILLTGLDCQHMFYQAIRVLHDEGAEVVNSSFSVMENRLLIIHTIHAKIEEYSRQSREIVARITERLNRFSCGS